jgi:hypothetical protein
MTANERAECDARRRGERNDGFGEKRATDQANNKTGQTGSGTGAEGD